MSMGALLMSSDKTSRSVSPSFIPASQLLQLLDRWSDSVPALHSPWCQDSLQDVSLSP